MRDAFFIFHFILTSFGGFAIAKSSLTALALAGWPTWVAALGTFAVIWLICAPLFIYSTKAARTRLRT